MLQKRGGGVGPMLMPSAASSQRQAKSYVEQIFKVSPARYRHTFTLLIAV